MKLLYTLFLSFYGLAAFSFSLQTNPDTLLSVDDLHFSSELEESMFDRVVNNEHDYFGLFESLTPDISEKQIESDRQQFFSLINVLRNEGISTKKPAKKIKLVYKAVHDNFFEKYELVNHFSDVFPNGYYNCVSATALYALSFDLLDISYQIKERPSHVYLIAYPEAERIKVEATDPTQGYMSFNEAYKKSFITNLQEHKLISESESRGKSIDELFDKYYFVDQDISINDLVAIQYLNDGLYKMDNGEFLEAYYQFQKSYFLYPHERAGFLMYTSAASYLSKLDPRSVEYARFIPEFSFFSKYGVTSSQLIGEFTTLSEIWLLMKSDTAEFSEIHGDFETLYSDSSYVSEVNYIYNYQMGVFFAKQGKTSLAYEYIARAFDINSANIQAQSLYIDLLNDKISRQSSLEQGIKVLEESLEAHKSLIEVPNFTDMILGNYLQVAHKSFYENSANKGLDFLRRFELLHQKVNESNLNHNAIGIAFSSAAMYYFKRGYKSKAREQIDRGLVISPNNQILMDRRRHLH